MFDDLLGSVTDLLGGIDMSDVLNVGAGIYGINASSGAASDYANALAGQADANYAYGVGAYDDYMNYLMGGGGGSGGGGGGGYAGPPSNAAQMKQGRKAVRRGLQQARGILSPFKDTAHTLLPVMSEAYQKGIGALGSLYDETQNRPAPKAVWEMDVPIPEHMVRR